MKRLKPALGLVLVALGATAPFLVVGVVPALPPTLGGTSFLVFRDGAEFFGVVLSFSILGLACSTYNQSRDLRLLFVSLGFLVAGVLDLVPIPAEAGILAAQGVVCAAVGFRLRHREDPLAFPWLAASALFLVAALGLAVYDTGAVAKVLGSLEQIVALGLVYRAVFVAVVLRPYDGVRKLADERQTLVRELNHRTKNTLQMIQGLIVLQASEGADVPEVKELVRKTEERIQAISLVHQKLFDSQDLCRIDLSSYVADLASLVLASQHPARNRVRIEAEVDGAVLLDTAVPLGLVLNELMTNSLRHGFPGDAEGTIRVRLGPGRAGWLEFQYEDDGIGLPPGFDLDRAETLGLTLLRTIGTQQLKGRVELAGTQGFHCRIEFPEDLYRARV